MMGIEGRLEPRAKDVGRRVRSLTFSAHHPGDVRLGPFVTTGGKRSK